MVSGSRLLPPSIESDGQGFARMPRTFLAHTMAWRYKRAKSPTVSTSPGGPTFDSSANSSCTASGNSGYTFHRAFPPPAPSAGGSPFLPSLSRCVWLCVCG